jgi:hypothetical protein
MLERILPKKSNISPASWIGFENCDSMHRALDVGKCEGESEEQSGDYVLCGLASLGWRNNYSSGKSLRHGLIT